MAAFFDSLAGRVFAMLLVGILASASVALALADGRRRADLERLNLERVVDRTEDFVALLDNASPAVRARVAAGDGPGARLAPATASRGEPDPALTRLLARRLGQGSNSTAYVTTPDACPAPPFVSRRTREQDRFGSPMCWLVVLTPANGRAVALTVGAPPPPPQLSSLDPVYLGVLAAAAAALALAVARITAAPVNALARAAGDLGRNLERPPLDLRGPREVRLAAAAFNLMQSDLKRHVAERTQILAAITHDLQTPLTRIRLRLEKVADEDLKGRLVHDLFAMQDLIREGLELARSEQSEEPLAPLDLGSLLESLVEDAQDAGRPVTLGEIATGDVLARPQALQRCLENLIDNAVKYGGSAQVSSVRESGHIAVQVSDEGPGIPTDKLDAVFEPFLRLEESRSRETGGAGLGLAIARRLARLNQAELVLRNRHGGGVEARLLLTPS